MLLPWSSVLTCRKKFLSQSPESNAYIQRLSDQFSTPAVFWLETQGANKGMTGTWSTNFFFFFFKFQTKLYQVDPERPATYETQSMIPSSQRVEKTALSPTIALKPPPDPSNPMTGTCLNIVII